MTEQDTSQDDQRRYIQEVIDETADLVFRKRTRPTTREYARAAAKSVITITQDIAPEILNVRNRIFTDYDFQRKKKKKIRPVFRLSVETICLLSPSRDRTSVPVRTCYY